MTNEIRHPAKYTDSFIPIFANELIAHDCKRVLDPFAGTGKIALVKDWGFKGEIVCSEIEHEFSDIYPYYVDEWRIGDSSDMYWAEDSSFDGIVTSPVYGNRMSDHFNSKDDSRRITYKHYLGRDLDKRNTGRMQWGEKYRNVHTEVYRECVRVLQHGGLFILNVSNHIRKGEEIDVSTWHRLELQRFGFILTSVREIPTPRMRYGQNHKARVHHENIYTFKLDKAE